MRSQTYYIEDSRFVVIKVESVLFRLPVALLAACCKALAHRIQTSTTSEGSAEFTEANPLELKEVNWQEFQWFLDYVITPSSPRNFSPVELEAILKVSDVYEAPAARAYAMEKLSAQLDSLPPARLLGLAINYRVPEWFIPSYAKLASSPLHTLSASELASIPPPVLSDLLQLRHKVYVFRLDVSRLRRDRLPLRNRDGPCIGRRCTDINLEGWDKVVERLLSDEWYSATEVVEALSSHFSWYDDDDGGYDLCPQCRSKYEGDLSTVMQEEASIMEEAAEQAFNVQDFKTVVSNEELISPKETGESGMQLM